MVNARPGHWDIDRCTWVGVEPADVMPPTVSREHAPDKVLDEVVVDVPAARAPAGSDEVPAPGR